LEAKRLQEFNPKEFVEKQVAEIRKVMGKERALIAVSGGVDSSTCAVLVNRAIGENLQCIMLDDAFMRENEPERVAYLLSQPPLRLPIKVVNVQERFLKALDGLTDAEEKRKVFREAFYKTLGETARKEGCRFLVQGTIAADIVETVGGIKTQHNVLEQMGINPKERFGFQVVEPLVSLYKWQVRKVARYLGVPSEISERQPFPGPGLSVRVVGEIKSDKLESLKKVTTITEKKLAKHKSSQYFAAILDNTERPNYPNLKGIQKTAAHFLNIPSSSVYVKIFKNKATGIVDGKRSYGEVAAIKAETAEGKIYETSIDNLVSLQARLMKENPTLTRVFYCIQEDKQKQPYVIVTRAIKTTDFLSASVAKISWKTLTETSEEILDKCKNVSCVYYDATPKPPATVEME
jgi:GMP synthase (glutamine-hydrolysing)